MNKFCTKLFPTFSVKIFLLLFTLFLPFSVAVSNEVNSYFQIPAHVSKQTIITEDIEIFYKSSPVYYEIGEYRSLNILEIYTTPDPLEGYNRVMFATNSILIGYIIKPIGKVYGFVIPEYFREGISRMADNIEVPGRLINCLLQARFERSGLELARFGINTTVGIVGFYDSARTIWEIEPEANSFGETFQYWGIGGGFYLVLPVQGSSTLRDSVGLIFDWLADPLTWIPPYGLINFVSLGIKSGIELNDMTLVIDDYERVYDSSIDPYQTFKTLWFAFKQIQMQAVKSPENANIE